MAEYLFLGFDLAARRQLEPGDPPANYKKEETIQAWRAEKRAELNATAHLVPTAGYVKEACVCDDSKVVFHAIDTYNQDETPAEGLIRWLCNNHGFRIASPYAFAMAMPLPELVLVGLGIKSCMKVACLEVLTGDSGLKVPAALWHGNGFLDPYEAIVPSDLRRALTLSDLLSEFGIGVSDTTPRGAAELAHALASRAQLLG